jgi:hypothetical protein
MAKVNRELKKRLIFYLCLFIVIGVPVYLWGPGPVQSRNMKQAKKEIAAVKKELSTDPRFSELMFLQSTADLGKIVMVKGDVPDKSSLTDLKSLMEKEISEKFTIRYFVSVQGDSVEPNQPEIE